MNVSRFFLQNKITSMRAVIIEKAGAAPRFEANHTSLAAEGSNAVRVRVQLQ